MKAEELRDMTIHELREKEGDLEDEIFRLKIKKFTTQLDNKMIMRQKRKELARLKTIIAEKVRAGSDENVEVVE